MGKDYDFTQIIDCKLIENNSSINNTYEKTKDKGKIETKSNTFSTETIYCNERYINIIIDYLNNPSININIRKIMKLQIKY